MTTQAKRDQLLDLIRGDYENAEALLGAYLLLQDRLVWTERQHESDAWHVTVTMEGLPVFGNDGHLLSEDRGECRFLAFVSLLRCVADPEMNP